MPKKKSTPLIQLCASILADKKAEDLVALDLRGVSTITDYYLIASGTSEPHLKALVNELKDRLWQDHQMHPLAVDGFPQSQWIVAHFGEVIVHLFQADKRAYYALEELWSDVPRVKLKAT